MTTKEKAKELVERFESHSRSIEFGMNFQDINHAKQSALICVDEIIEANPMDFTVGMNCDKAFWKEVKKEIEKL